MRGFLLDAIPIGRSSRDGSVRSSTDSTQESSDSKQTPDEQTEEKRIEETRDFYTQRKTLVKLLEKHSINIQTRPFTRLRILRSRDLVAKFLILLRSTPTFTHGSKLERCAPRRIQRIFLSLRKANRMLEHGLFWEASAALALISRYVGRLRLVGVVDLFADGMDEQARELHLRYAWKSGDDPAFSYILHSMSVLMGFVDSCCGCCYCRW